MDNKPYWQQEYHEAESRIPEPTFGQIFRELFLAPFKWSARSTRKGFWISYAISIVVTLILACISAFSLSDSGVEYNENTLVVLSHTPIWTVVVHIIIGLILLWLALGELGFMVRRLHDSNHSGWWIWLNFVPFGGLILLYFLILPTVEEPVRWGGYLFIE